MHTDSMQTDAKYSDAAVTGAARTDSPAGAGAARMDSPADDGAAHIDSGDRPLYEADGRWDEFYRELDPDKRKALYGILSQQYEDDGLNAFRGELLELRYTDPKDSARKVDRFLWNMMILPEFVRHTPLFRFSAERENRKILRALGLDNAGEWDEKKRAAAYWEYRNTAARYLSTCSDPGYARKLFGTMQSSEDEKLEKTARDFYSMTVTAAAKFGDRTHFGLFARALRDSFFAYTDDAARMFSFVRGQEEKKGKKRF